ncbi:MAG: helix-turn-helix transcriptional regulator [Halobacteriales archaeon]|nr:helix-turn-helix transcriptional regulator [Halobacteriales archaeon]
MARTAKGRPGAGCGVGDLFRLLGKAHMMDVLYVLMSRPDAKALRFVDLQRELGISPNTLSERLRELVEAGLLTRTAYNEIPPRVDYQPTAKARALEAMFKELAGWAGRYDLQPEPAPALRPGAKT